MKVSGSERAPLPGARLVGAADEGERIRVTVVLRARRARGGVSPEQLGAEPVLRRRYLDLAELEAVRGADPADVERVQAFARAHGLEPVATSVAGRIVTLAGPAGAFSAAFRVPLGRYDHPGGSYRGRVGPVHVPRSLAAAVEGVLGLDDRPQSGSRAAGRGTRFRASQVARLYDFPPGLDGQGQCVGILQFGGGFRRADLEAYARRLGLPAPKVAAVRVGEGRNRPGSAADGEVLLDVELVAGLVPRARVLVYFAPNTDQGWVEAVTAAVHDARRPSVLSISWGAPEARWTPQGMRAVDRAFQDAALLGVTVCCASGDRGSAGGAEFPASSPHVLACGGTSLLASRGRIVREDAWSDEFGSSGGGVSGVFQRPAWQAGADVPGQGRGVPDVAGNAEPGYEVVVGGKLRSAGGTSAVAPLWAGLIVRCNERLGQRVGYLNPLLYRDRAVRRAFRDVTAGGNGRYEAGPGWDPVTGWGSPRGRQLLAALAAGAGR